MVWIYSLPLCVSADQVYGDQDMHEVVRKHCMDYLVSHPAASDAPPPCPPSGPKTAQNAALVLQMKNADYFSNYVTEDFTTYINRKRKNNCHGNHIEMQAMAEMYNRPVEVYQYGTGEPFLSDFGGGGHHLSDLASLSSLRRANKHLSRHPPKQRRTHPSQLPPQHPLQLCSQPKQGHHRCWTGTPCLQTRGTIHRKHPNKSQKQMSPFGCSARNLLRFIIHLVNKSWGCLQAARPAALRCNVCNVCPSVRGPDTDEIGHQDVGGVVDRTADAGGQEESDRLGGHE